MIKRTHLINGVLLGVGVVACSGKENSVPAVDLVISESNVTGLASAASELIPGCSGGTGAAAAIRRMAGGIHGMRRASGGYSLTGSPPYDMTGDCGGLRTFKNYSHESGVTSGTMVFDQYCETLADGTRATQNGNVAFVDHGTPSDYGPLRNYITASSSSFETTSSKGESFDGSVSGFKYTTATPGSPPSDAAPDRVTVESAQATDKKNGKTYRLADYSESVGASEYTLGGVLCDSEFGCARFETDAKNPVQRDPATGNFTGGTFVVEGAEGTSARIDVVPGASWGALVTEVNGASVSGKEGYQLDCSVPASAPFSL